MKRGLGAAFTLALALAPKVASAQASTLYLDRLFMAGTPNDGVGIWRPEVSDKTRFFGQFGVGFQLNPIRNENVIGLASQVGRYPNPVDTQTGMYVSVGAEFLKRVAVQIEMPAILGQTTNTINAGPDKPVSAKTSAPGDLRFDARVVVFRNDARTFRLGALAALWAPTGDVGSWGGDGKAHGALGLAAEYDFKSFYVDVNTGFHFRPTLSYDNFHTGNEWTYGIGAFVPLRDNTLRVGIDLFGSAGIDKDHAFTKDNSTLEWMAEGRMTLDDKKRLFLGGGAGTRLTPGYSPDFRVVAMVGYSYPIEDTVPPSPPRKFVVPDIKPADTDHDGLPDDIDLCPTEPEDHKQPNPDDGCPAPSDRDGDGIPDDVDKCPDKPEDFDKIDDEDGCPEDDFDKDSVPDAVDACPKEPGEPSAEKDKNGCPVYIRRLEGSTEIEILKQVQFATGSAKILSNSFKILDEVVKLMTINKDIKLVAIEGHTDNKGKDKDNEKLSDDRANSVRQYLIDHGIHPDRLTAKGYGPYRPIADNKTADGRQKNRRVEFHIRDKADTGTPENSGGAQQAPQQGATPPQ
jgi:outer membrane protein OmpA-like peptidoglycan-associated protein